MKEISKRPNYLNLTRYASIAKEASLNTIFLIVMIIHILLIENYYIKCNGHISKIQTHFIKATVKLLFVGGKHV